MMSLVGQILTPDGWISGEIRFDERIRAIQERTATSRHGLPRIVPGFIDLHVQGGGGGIDVMQGGGTARSVASFHAQFGTTAMLATTMTDSRGAIARARQVIVLADSAKVSRIGLHRIASVDKVRAVVTDRGMDPSTRSELVARGIDVLDACTN